MARKVVVSARPTISENTMTIASADDFHINDVVG